MPGAAPFEDITSMRQLVVLMVAMLEAFITWHIPEDTTSIRQLLM